jgi:hypothetical protein
MTWSVSTSEIQQTLIDLEMLAAKWRWSTPPQNPRDYFQEPG